MPLTAERVLLLQSGGADHLDDHHSVRRGDAGPAAGLGLLLHQLPGRRAGGGGGQTVSDPVLVIDCAEIIRRAGYKLIGDQGEGNHYVHKKQTNKANAIFVDNIDIFERSGPPHECQPSTSSSHILSLPINTVQL